MSKPLANELRTRLGEALGRRVEVSGLRRVAGGASRQTWSCDLRIGARVMPLIVRRDIADGLLDTDGDGEFRLLDALHQLELPVPRPWLRTGPMTVVERIAGVDARKLMAHPGRAHDPQALGEELVRIQVALHEIDWRRLAGVLDAPDGAPHRRELDHWEQILTRTGIEAEPLLRAAISWLDAHPPPATELALVHGDFKANNLLVSPDGRVTVLDWEMAHIGDPVEDLAWTRLWRTEADLVGGMLEPDAYIAAYEAARGVDVDPDALLFWELFSLVKLAAILLTGVRDGAANLPTLKLLGRATPHVEGQIAERLTTALEADAA
jgi:aminoglycoside phosphotransferase (APT) family kinase protein